MNLQKRDFIQTLAVFVLACVLRFALIIAWYTPNLQNFSGGDYKLYSIGAEDILQRGSFDNSLFLIRPPLFPIMISVLGLNANIVLVVNAILGALIAPLTYLFARQCRLSKSLSLLAALIVAVDPASIIYTAFLGSEALANIGLLISLILLLASLRSSGLRSGLLLATIAGVALAFSSLARPATFLLWAVLAVWGMIAYRRKWALVIVFMLVSAIGVGTWIVHNGVVFGNYTFSTIGTYNLLYYRAASVESRGAGLTLDETYTELSRRVEARLGHDTSKVDAGTRYGHEAATAELQPVIQNVALEVFIKYPIIYLLTVPIGLYHILALTDVASPLAMVIIMGWNLCLVVATGAGLIVLYRKMRRDMFWLILLICAYYIVGTLVVQTSGIDTRARTMLTPLMAIAAVYCLQSVFRRRFNTVIEASVE
ncbi:MAG: hypothetical protein ABI970_04320 [Chloroflexota bacterium]